MKRLAFAVRVLAPMVLAALLTPPARGAGNPAIVKLTKPDVTCEIVFEDGKKLVVTPKGAPLNEGTYWVKSLSLFKKDKDGQTWEMRAVGNLTNVQVIIVEEGQEKILDLGPPIAFHGGVSQPKDKPDILAIQLSVLGRYGEGYLPQAYVGGGRRSPPMFRILTADGKKVFEDRFAATTTNSLHYEWTIPRGLTGKFKLEIQPDIGPFEWVVGVDAFDIPMAR